MNLKQDIINYSKFIGIDRIGFATADPFLEEREILQERKAKGLISPFEEQNIELRCNPRKLMSEAKTIICFAMGYLLATSDIVETHDPIGETNLKGKFSRYAVVTDYHHVLANKLKAIVRYIVSKYDGNFQIYIDTGSLIDKAAAQRAGIGWIGENTCLFTPELGSWVFLGEILTDIEIEPDEPMKPRCDHCGKCIRACPTGALIAPYTINPFRCLSYITQMRGIIPEEFIIPLGNRLFGCDTCQDACPKNRDVKIPRHEEFVLAGAIETNLQKLIRMDNAKFNAMFKSIAAGWRGKNIIRRNAVCALNNIGGKDAIELLNEAANDPSEVVRRQALMILKDQF